MQQPVTVITAPAGSGKGVLVDQWMAQHVGHPVARVTLQRDDTWSRVAGRINAALPPGGESILVIESADAPIDGRLARELAGLAERAPATTHLVVVTRSRAAPVLDRLHGRDDLAFVNAAHLAFTPTEARQLVRAVATVDLTGPQLDRLMAVTQGWAVALHLAAIGLRDAPDADAYVDGFGGDERHIASYLFDEVFEPQSDPVRRFLAETSVLEHLSGDLCDAVTGRDDGAATLRALEHAGAFVRRMPGSRQWFAYHPLFRDVLRRELRRGGYDDESVLLLRAAAWFAARDEPEAAAACLIDAEAWNALVEMTDAYGQRMYESGRARDALRWLGALPAAHARQSGVAVRRAYLHTMVGESHQAAQIVHDVEVSHLSRGEQAVVDALRSTWALFDAAPESAIQAADDALHALVDVDVGEIPDIFGMTSPTSLAMLAASSRARALWHLGEVAEARRVLLAGVAQEGVYTPWLLRTVGSLAVLEAWEGNLRAADAHASRALKIAESAGLMSHAVTIDARIAKVHVLRERGDLRRAIDELEGAESIASRTRRCFQTAMLIVERGRWHLAAGESLEGLAALDGYRAASELPAPPLIAAHLAAVEVSLLLSIDDTDRAASIVTSTTDMPTCPVLVASEVHVAVAQRDLAAAGDRLRRWTPSDEQPFDRLLRELWGAVVDHETGDRRCAIDATSAVLAAAEREGHVRLFLDGGRPVDRLLRSSLHSAPHPHADRLMRIAQRRQQGVATSASGLSKRELEVARYLPTPLSSAEIAERLYISLNTLKTHLRTIYGKLGATNRREAIQRAEELGIA